MFCGQCGKEWVEGTAFCAQCGSPICLADMKVPATSQTWLTKIIALIFLLCSMGLFFASTFNPAFSVEGRGEWMGSYCVLLGWLGMITFPPAGLTWLANPASAAAWITFRVPMASFVFSIIAVLIGASFLLFIGTGFPIDEAGHTAPITEVHLGYWLWLASMVVMLLGNGIQMIALYWQQQRRRNVP